MNLISIDIRVWFLSYCNILFCVIGDFGHCASFWVKYNISLVLFILVIICSRRDQDVLVWCDYLARSLVLCKRMLMLTGVRVRENSIRWWQWWWRRWWWWLVFVRPFPCGINTLAFVDTDSQHCRAAGSHRPRDIWKTISHQYYLFDVHHCVKTSNRNVMHDIITDGRHPDDICLVE